MEQVQQLLEILKETPEMALWGLGLYFLFILLQLASWVYALKIVLEQFIKRYFDYKEKVVTTSKGNQIVKMFEDQKMSNVDYSMLVELLNSVKKNTDYLHYSDLRNAINKLKENK